MDNTKTTSLKVADLKVQLDSKMAELKHAVEYLTYSFNCATYEKGRKALKTAEEILDEVGELHYQIEQLELDLTAQEYERKYRELTDGPASN